MKATFLRVVESDDKPAAMLRGIHAIGKGEASNEVFVTDPLKFRSVPGSPFAYWLSPSIRMLFDHFTSFNSEEHQRKAVSGLSTEDDFRFIRLFWEVPTRSLELGHWIPLAKGGRRSPFYGDIPTVIRWEGDGNELRALVIQRYGNAGKRIYNESYFGKPGITWPLRGVNYSAQAVPSGCIFTVGGKMAFAPRGSLSAILGLMNSSLFDYLIRVSAGKIGGVQYEVGLIGKTPVPELKPAVVQRLEILVRRGWDAKCKTDSMRTNSHYFQLPALLWSEPSGQTIYDLEKTWADQEEKETVEVCDCLREIDNIAFDSYRVGGDDRATISAIRNGDSSGNSTKGKGKGEGTKDRIARDSLANIFVSWLVGVIFGRFDLRLASGERSKQTLPDPFEPYPNFAPGMLPCDKGALHPKIPTDYPIKFAERGIVESSPEIDVVPVGATNLIERLRSVLGEIWGPAAMQIEADICQMLGTKTLRDYLRRPAGFFADHLREYSKSNRAAPIYWPLSTMSGSYTLWIYYPKLSDQSLYACVNEFLNPKLRDIETDLSRMRDAAPLDAKAQRKYDSLMELQGELEAMREELLRVAKLPYKPDQNDGVLITAAPLWRLFRHKPWQKELMKCSEALEDGEYDWAHLAYAIWPDRVREVCKKDESIAIAQGLEELYDG